MPRGLPAILIITHCSDCIYCGKLFGNNLCACIPGKSPGRHIASTESMLAW